MLAAIQVLRSSGERVIQALSGQSGGATEMGCDRELQMLNGRWQPVAANK
jgi:ATP phosphoribosyltransferase regulatory subunit